MAHYDIFRHHLAIKYPAYGHALWEPRKGHSYPAPVNVGDMGFIREGRFLRLFNVLLPSGDPSHRNYGVPEYHEQLTLRMEEHIIRGTLGPNNLCSARVSSVPERKEMAEGPDSPAEVVFSCRKKQGAVLSLPTQAQCENTVALGDFGEWMIKHIDSWFAWVAGLGLGIARMEDIILVTGTHLTRSWTNVAFPGGQEDGQAKFGAHVATRGDKVTINWKFSHEYSRGAVLNYGPAGEDPPEDQCIFIRGFRVARKLIILPRGLKAAAGPNPDPKGDDCEPDVELTSILAIPEYRDPLHILLEYLVGGAPNCDMALVHDDDLTRVDGLGDDTSLEALQPDTLLSSFRRLKPKVHDVLLGPEPSTSSSSANADAGSLRVVILSTIFEERHPLHRRVNLISHLPEELLIAILCYLDGSSIAACNQTCRSLQKAFLHSMQLQYEVALFSCGMRDGQRRDVNHAAQLKRLLAYDAAWRQLDWTDARSLDHLSCAFHPTAVSGSTIAFIPFDPGPVSGVKLFIQQLPSTLRGTDERHWELQFQLMSVHDTLMDVSQDLLILLEPDSLSNYTTIYHVYSLSTGRPHPLAAKEGLFEMQEGWIISGGASGLCGDYIGATAYSLSDKSTHLILWNWKTGEHKVDAPLPTPELGLRPTFTFLDPYHIVVGFLWTSDSQPRELLVCALDSQRLRSNSGDGLIDSVSTYLFRIPKLLKRRDFWEVHTHRNSVPLLHDACLSTPHYFDSDPADQLVVIEMASRWRSPSTDKPDPVQSLCVPLRAILNRIIPTTSTPLVFAWEHWGEGRVILSKRFDSERRLPALSRVCGLRHISRKPVRNGGAPTVFQVMDFHPGRAARIAQSRALGNGPPGADAYAPRHAIIEVPLPREMLSVDPVLLSTSICQDALIVFERMGYDTGGLRRVFVCSF